VYFPIYRLLFCPDFNLIFQYSLLTLSGSGEQRRKRRNYSDGSTVLRYLTDTRGIKVAIGLKKIQQNMILYYQ
jgi:hypothetical protein